MPYDARFDFNQNGVIDEEDSKVFESLLSVHMYKYGSTGKVNPSDPESVLCDLNNDGQVDILDWNRYMFQYYGQALTPVQEVTPVQEKPATWLWLVGILAALVILPKKRRQK